MTKAELVAALSHDAGISQERADMVLRELAGMVAHALQTAGEITLPGIGKLVLTERAARTGRNPRTGEAIEIPASRSVKLRPALALKRALNPEPQTLSRSQERRLAHFAGGTAQERKLA